jgi:hypothetical protein
VQSNGRGPQVNSSPSLQWNSDIRLRTRIIGFFSCSQSVAQPSESEREGIGDDDDDPNIPGPDIGLESRGDQEHNQLDKAEADNEPRKASLNAGIIETRVDLTAMKKRRLSRPCQALDSA